MPGRLKDIRIVFIAALVAAAVAVSSDYLYFSNLEWRYRTSRLDKKLVEKERKAERILSDMETQLKESNDPSLFFHNSTGSDALADGIALLVYKENRIAYWSDNSISFPLFFEVGFDNHKPVFFSNGWFIPVWREYADCHMLALIKVYQQYPIENKYLRSDFPAQFMLPSGTQITFDKTKTSFLVNGIEKEFHFGLVFPEKKPNTPFLIIPLFFWLIFLLLLIRLIVLANDWPGGRLRKSLMIPSGLAAMLLIYIIILITGLPQSVKSTELFSPFLWSAGRFLPSVGHMALLGLLLVSGLNIYLSKAVFNSPVKRNDPAGSTGSLPGSPIPLQGTLAGSTSSLRGLAVPVAMMVSGFFFFLAGEALFRNLVLNSAISFEAYKIIDLSFMSLAGFLSILLFLSIPLLFFLRAYRMMAEMSVRTNLAVTAATSLVLPAACLAVTECSFWGILCIVLLACTTLLWQRKSYSLLTLIVAYAGLAGIFSTALIIKYSVLKEKQNLKVMAISLSNDNDMVAEDMLIDLWPELKNDTTLASMMEKDQFSDADINIVFRYLEDKYFNGYWENYDLNIVICRDDSPLMISSSGSPADNCFNYFNERLKNEGDTITGSGFWFMRNQGGRAYYFSRLLYENPSALTNGLFIELVSHIESYLEGYPELLLNASQQRFARLRDISYAKYYDSTLVLRSGSYPYDNQIIPEKSDSEYRFVAVNGFRHLYYNLGDMTLVITTKSVKPLDRIITFAYLFVVILVFSFILLLVFIHHPGDLLRFDTFKRRLQLSFGAVLSVVFIIIIVGALVLTTNQFRNNHNRILEEKAVSISIELEHKFSAEQSLEGWSTPEYPSLNYLLVKFSNVFMTDINLYSASGSLLATSRPEVFSRKLEGNMINPEAFGILLEKEKNEYIAEEHIGGLNYLSSYTAFYNENNKLLAYINLPYFTMENLLTGEISNLVVTLINFTLLLLMLMMWLAVFLSERITSPLNLLQQAMASVKYGMKNKPISYGSHDEVGELVKQYNRMIDELEDSAKKLARSEREMAWREMARQIAHEIKNPLTPMKLNVQQLFKSWNDRVPDFEGKIRTFTDNQIEYIDNLSNIATAFSYFARLPDADPSEVNVVTQLKTSLEMFGNAENVSVTLDSGDISKAVVMADREHLNGIFSNILKNALQAIPSGRNGVIKVKLEATVDKIQIRFTDNGTGIPEELQSRMFTPNFTTKSSGMGLGLSIAKRYTETAGGTIWFESVPGDGASFTVELPLLYTVERNTNTNS
jgi:two-component system, NtrC family, nitrogen regulation sensor histidine kinase NtrY